MFSFISSYFTGQKLNKNLVESYIYAISKKNNIEELNEIFENLLPNIPLDNYYSIDVYNELFSEFDYEQINTFSNNLCSKIEQKMKDDLDQLNYCTELLLNFTVSIFVRFNTIRELITKSYNIILENNNNENMSIILSKSFPFNVFILCVNAITNEEFFFRKDIFQKEVDKFDFTYRLMNIIFCIVHICDSNFEKSSQSSIEFLDTIKLFLFLQDEKNIFISQENQKKFLIKLYNTSIHNFETLVNNRINPIIDKAQCYKTQTGHVIINLVQRLPVIRIKADNGEDYYVDEFGNIMPETSYANDLVVATGAINKKYAQKFLTQFGNYLIQHPLWRSQIEQLNILHDGTVEAIPRVGDHVVYLGKPVNIDKKFTRLEKFYRYGLSQAGWNKYSYISLEFDNQIICKKRKFTTM